MTVLWILLAVVVLVLVLGWLVFRLACVPIKPLPLEDGAALERRLSPVHFRLVQEGLAWLREHPAQELEMPSHDGLLLRGRWIPAENPRGTILMLHGWHGCPETDFCCIFSVYHKLGFNLLFVNQRAQDGRGGKYITFGAKESMDCADWVRFHNKTFGPQPVILDGISMGAATVLLAMGRDLPDNVRGVVADSGYTSPWEILCSVSKRLHVPPFPVLYVTRLWCILLAGFDPKAHTTVKAMAGSHLPVLMIHGLADNFVPSHMSQTTCDAYQGPKELILVENATHGMGYVTEPERCCKALTDFFDRILKS